MRVPQLNWLSIGFLAMSLTGPAWAQVEVTVEELDIGGNPPGLEGMPGMFLTNQDTGTEHLVVFGGCTEDSMWDQALVLSDVSGGFDDLTWTTVPVPGMGAACEHIVAGPGDVGYLIGGYKNDFYTMRPGNEVLEIRLGGSASQPVIETTEVTVGCTDCPGSRIGHDAVWVDSFEGCDGGGVLFAGGMSSDWQLLDDVWLFCPASTQLKSGNYAFNKFVQMVMSSPSSDFKLIEDKERRILYRVIPFESSTVDTMVVQQYSKEHGRWRTLNPIPYPGYDPIARTAFSGAILENGNIQVVGGMTSDVQPTDEVWEFDVRTNEWDRRSTGVLKAVSNILNVVVSGLLKQGGTTRTILFGGVEDFSVPRVVSNSTFLITFTGLESSPDLAVPAVARVQGAGAFFTSLMHLYAAGTSDLELEMSFTPREGSGGAVTTVNHTVPAGVMQTIEDPLETLFGFSGGAGRVGSVLITVTSGSAADLMAQTVVFAELDSGEEYGQFFPAMPIGDAISSGQTAYLNTTEDPTHNRVNIGLMAVADDTRFRVRPVDPLSSGLAAPMTFDLDTGGNTQINNLHTSFGLGAAANVVVEVEVLAGSGFAYASVLDGSGAYTGTSDPTTILPSLAGSGKVTLLEIGSIQGLNEFSGSASITNYSNRSATVRADFFQRGESGVRTTENLTIAAGDTVGYSDLGADLFGVSGDVGSVVLSSTNNTRIGATGREFAIFRGGQNQVIGTAGQLIAGQTDGDRLAAGTTYHFIGLRQERGGGAVERSHFAVYNPAWGDAEVTVRLYDGASGTLEGERSWIVERRTLIQVNNVIRAINSGYDGDEKRIEVEVDKPVFMNAFRVNRWGDPVTLSPFDG